MSFLNFNIINSLYKVDRLKIFDFFGFNKGFNLSLYNTRYKMNMKIFDYKSNGLYNNFLGVTNIYKRGNLI